MSVDPNVDWDVTRRGNLFVARVYPALRDRLWLPSSYAQTVRTEQDEKAIRKWRRAVWTAIGCASSIPVLNTIAIKLALTGHRNWAVGVSELSVIPLATLFNRYFKTFNP